MDAKVLNTGAQFITADWGSSAPYSQTVSVEGIRSTDVPIIDLNLSSGSESTIDGRITSWGRVSYFETGDGTITAVCRKEKPTNAFDVIIKVVR